MGAIQKLGELWKIPTSPNECFLLFLTGLIICVVIKHLIFHTWPTLYQKGNALIPESIRWKLIHLKTWKTGKSQPMRMIEYVQNDTECRSPVAILNKLDYYGWNIEWHMSLGDEKVKIVTDIIRRKITSSSNKKSFNMLEAGSYAGYSTVLFASLLPENGNLYSSEIDREFQEVSRSLVNLAGLQDKKVRYIHGDTNENLENIKTDMDGDYFDIVFLDHEKDLYLPTLLQLQDLKLVRSGTVVIADNAIYPGCPDLLVYVRTAPNKFRTKLHPCFDAYSPQVQDGIEEIEYI